MKRREAILQVALTMGSALSAPSMAAILDSYQPHRVSKRAPSAFLLQPAQEALLDEITEVIMPTTSTPGAKAAKVAGTIQLILKDCYKPAQQEHFLKGLDAVEAESKKTYSKSFVELPIDQKTAILKQFEQMAKTEAQQKPKQQENLSKNPETTLGAVAASGSDQTQAKLVDAETGVVVKDEKKNAPLTPFFKLVKELTILGYFSSEIGCTQALKYVKIPGRYEGVVKLKDGQKAWAT
ncbi:gluconate 2-dehydrogenase subunit 3 family protein [Spirosoma daeguense]